MAIFIYSLMPTQVGYIVLNDAFKALWFAHQLVNQYQKYSILNLASNAQKSLLE